MPSLRKAIDQKCRACIYDPKSGMGTWREQVGGCLSPDCGLYPVRPMPSRGERPRMGQNVASMEISEAMEADQ